MNEEIGAFIDEGNGFERTKISNNEFWQATEKKDYLNTKKVNNAGISVLKIKAVGEPYKKTYNGKDRVYIDLTVVAEDGLEKGNEFIFSIGVQNARTIKEKLGIDFSNWIDKRLKIAVEKNGDIYYVAVKEVLE